MIFDIKTYDPSKHKITEHSIFIQSKGMHAGRPMRTPKANCWIIETNVIFTFEILSVLWISKIYDVHIGGSVIPFLRLHDFKKIVTPFLKAAVNYQIDFEKHLNTIYNIDLLIATSKQRLKLIESLKITTAMEVLKGMKPFV